jgi:cytochrome c-type biogenesis protein CcmH
MRFVQHLVLALLLLVPALPVMAYQPDEVLKDPKLETRARALSAGLRCMVCQNQSIDDSNAELAKDLRVLIRTRLKQGDSDKQVLDYVVARYGEFVLLKPRFAGHTLILWLTGPALLLGAAVLLFVRRRKVGELATPNSAPLSDEEKQALKKLME